MNNNFSVNYYAVKIFLKNSKILIEILSCNEYATVNILKIIRIIEEIFYFLLINFFFRITVIKVYEEVPRNM